MVVLYSNHCPRCNIIKAKLETAKINYKLVDDPEQLEKLGYDFMPVLEVDGEKFTSMIQMNAAIDAIVASRNTCTEEQEK